MAELTGASGSFYSIGMFEGYVKVNVDWVQTFYPGADYSTIGITLTFSRTDANTEYLGGSYWIACNGGVTVDGETVPGVTWTIDQFLVNINSIDDTPTKLTGSIQVKHTEAKEVTITTGTIRINNYTYPSMSFGVAAATATVTLQKIESASSISSAGNVNFGSACSIQFDSYAGMYYKAEFSLGSWSAATSAFSPGDVSGYTYSGFTIPYAAAYQIPNAASGRMTVTLRTYTDAACTAQLGEASASGFTVTLPASVKPSISSGAVQADNSSVTVMSSWTAAVAGFSKLKVTAAASGVYGSTISRFVISGAYSATVAGSSLSYTGDVITTSGTKAITITCVDSRGRSSAAMTVSIKVEAYSRPSVSSFGVTRNSAGAAVATVVYSYNSVGGNRATAVLWYKPHTNTTWSKYGTIPNNTETTTTIVVSDDTSYDFRIVVTDTIGNAEAKEALLSTTSVLLDFKAGGDGIGIGKICESTGMEVSLDATFFAKVILSAATYGDTLPTSGVAGQIFLKRIT